MVLRKSTALFKSCSHLPNFHHPTEFSHISRPPYTPCEHNIPSQRRARKRHYATVEPKKPSISDPDRLEWPKSSSVPTPYQILHHNPRTPYTKHCFYQLVKVYHPDRNHSNHHEPTPVHDHIRRLPGHVKMERYRLIVAANEILSDPVKRSAYDRYGTGWSGRVQDQVFTWRQHVRREDASAMGGETRWSGFDTNDSPFANATWEDWERWYNRHKKPEPLYTSNGGFVSLVALALVIGGIAQSLQVDRHQELFSQQAEIRHRNAGRTLTQHRETGKNIGGVDERIQGFLRVRDEAGYGVLGESDNGSGQVDRRMSGEQVVCMSDGIQQKRGRGAD